MMYFEIDDFNGLRGALRTMCAAFAEEKVPDEAVFDSKLVANELLSNVLQHGGGRAVFRAAREGDEILLCVRGANGFRPPERSELADALSERGRGLYLVDRYCARREWSEQEGIRVYIKIERQ